MFEATKPLLAILYIAVGTAFINMALKIFNKGEWQYKVNTLAEIMVVGIVLGKLTLFLADILKVFK